MSRILLVEDEQNQRLLYEQELEDEGYEVIAVPTGEAALKVFNDARPNLVIIDMLLPGMSGIEVMERMISLDANVPIIVNSAYSSPAHDFVTHFARAYVVKSGDLTNLKNEVRKALASTPTATITAKTND